MTSSLNNSQHLRDIFAAFSCLQLDMKRYIVFHADALLKQNFETFNSNKDIQNKIITIKKTIKNTEVHI